LGVAHGDVEMVMAGDPRHDRCAKGCQAGGDGLDVGYPHRNGLAPL